MPEEKGLALSECKGSHTQQSKNVVTSKLVFSFTFHSKHLDICMCATKQQIHGFSRFTKVRGLLSQLITEGFYFIFLEKSNVLPTKPWEGASESLRLILEPLEQLPWRRVENLQNWRITFTTWWNVNHLQTLCQCIYMYLLCTVK